MAIGTKLKPRLRRLADRVALPYVEEISHRVAGETAVGASNHPAESSPGDRAGVPTDFFHRINHELRTVELERVPKGARSALSVGASGRWYFDWFERAVGPVVTHYGVEAFEPRPPDLPPYAVWIPDTADRMSGVSDAAVDVVFAGQTTEHLWADELTDFLLESHRVLTDDGLLVLDSPNRLVTEHLRWSHGGHTVELSADEIATAVGLAGFTVQSVRGLWRCRFGGRVLQLEEELSDPAMLVRRIAEGPVRPDDSFVWWLVARRAAPSDPAALRRFIHDLYARHWPTRVCRGMFTTPGTDRAELIGGEPLATLPFYLRPGDTFVSVTLLEGAWDDVDGFRLRLHTPGDHVLHVLPIEVAKVEGATASWTFSTELVFAATLSLVAEATSKRIVVELPLGVRQVPAGA